MVADPRLDELLDRWDDLRDQISLEEFIRQQCHGIPLPLIEEFKIVVQKLQSVDANLGIPDQVGRSSTLRGVDTGKPPVLPPLVAGAEPVPNFRLVQRLGEGGFGEVWSVVGPGGFPAALKVIKLGTWKANIEAKALEIMKQIRHPNLVSLFACWQIGDFLYVAMELADKTLLDRLREARGEGQPGIPRGELLRYMEQVAGVLDFLHAPHPAYPDKIGLQHRDVKPENLLLQGGSIKLGDFGVARLLEHTMTGHTGAKSSRYAAPEFFLGKTSRHSDQYSLAVTYCHLRGGRLPFSDSRDLTDQHLNAPPDLSMLPQFERPAVERALAKDPHDRWLNCQVFVEALKKAAAEPVGKSDIRETWSVGLGLGQVNCLAFMADGSHAVLGTAHTGPNANCVVLVELPQGREVQRFKGHSPSIRSVAISPGATEVYSSSDDWTLRSWDVASGREWRRFEGFRGQMNCIAPSPDGKRLASGGRDRYVWLWHVIKGTKDVRFSGWFSRAHKNSVLALDYSADSRLILSGGMDGSVQLWRVVDGRRLHTFRGHSKSVLCVAISRDQHHAVSGGQRDGVWFWDLTNGQGIWSSQHRPASVTCVTFASPGVVVAGYMDGTIALLEEQTGKVMTQLQAHTKKVLTVRLSSDGQSLLSGSSDGSLKGWNLSTLLAAV